MNNLISFIWKSKRGEPLANAENILLEQWKMQPLYSPETFKDVVADYKSTIDASFIIPMYNSERFLKRCVDSLLNQETQYKYEIILIDDGSKDKTYQLIKEYEQQYPALVRAIHQENKGTAAARNNGINLAQGQYIGFIDSDDWVEKNYVNRIISKAYETGADMIKTAFATYINGEFKKVEQAWDDTKTGDLGEKIMLYQGYVWGGVFRRSLWKDIRFPVGYWYEDMITRMILYRKCTYYENIKEVLYCKNVHSTNSGKIIWNNGKPKSIEQYYLLKLLVKEYEQLGLPEDVTFYRCILDEASYLLWCRTRGLEKKTRKAIFTAAAQLLKRYRKEEYTKHLSEFERKYDKVFRNFDYTGWCLVSIYKMSGKIKRMLQALKSNLLSGSYINTLETSEKKLSRKRRGSKDLNAKTISYYL